MTGWLAGLWRRATMSCCGPRGTRRVRCPRDTFWRGPPQPRWVSPPSSYVTSSAATPHCGDWGAEVIHDHTLTGPIFGQRYSDVILATTNHGPFHEDLIELYRAVDDEVAVIAISQHQASQATGVKIAATIHHGLDVDAFPVGDGSGDAEGEYFLFLGRMVPEKGARRAAVAARKAGVRLADCRQNAGTAGVPFFCGGDRTAAGR